MRISKLIKSAKWLINIRWVAVFFVIAATYVSKNYLNISLEDKKIYLLSFALLIENLLSFILFKVIIKSKSSKISTYVKILVNFQISCDLTLLTLILHFSGGIENPFLIVYIFHMILTSIILSLRASFFQTSYALILIGLMTFLECFKIIPHYPLTGFVDHSLYSNTNYLTWTGMIFIVISYLTVLMTGYITQQLRKYEDTNRLINDKLLENDRLKSEYVLKLTHDIKGHLAAILSCLEVVSSNITGELNNQQKEFIGRAQKRASFLANFIKDLLNLTKMQLQNQLDMNFFSLKESIKKILPPYKNSALDKSIFFTYHIDKKVDQIFGNRFSIEESIENLLMNAFDYTPANGKVNLNIQNKLKHITIEVTDNGIGIPEKEIKNIFKEFYRGSKAKMHSPDGTGMGLPIIKQIVEQHKGEIKVESVEGTGTKFIITLPKK